eukprot:622317-Pyramimonas_sp.AAC.1
MSGHAGCPDALSSQTPELVQHGISERLSKRDLSAISDHGFHEDRKCVELSPETPESPVTESLQMCHVQKRAPSLRRAQ